MASSGSYNYQRDPRYSSIQYYDDEKRPLMLQPLEEKSSFRKELEVVILMILVIAFGALNRVASKIMTQPMANYSFFLSLFNGIAYVIFYYGILFVRYYAGRVSREHMLFPWTRMGEVPGSTTKWWDTLPGVKYFVISGFMDGLGNVLGLIPTPYLTGTMMSLMGQTIVFFSVVCAIVMLRTKYTIWQIGSVLIVVAGAVVALIPQFQHKNTSNNPLGWLILYGLSTLPNAISFTIKEMVFKKRQGLEVFVVNSTGSLFQLLWWPATIPITVLLQQTNGKPLRQYIHDGFECFSGHTPHDDHKADCSPNPYPYLIYIVLNLTFNIFLLILLKRASALQGFMAIKAILPIAVVLFLIKWPLIGSSSIDMYTIISLFIILIGLALYRYTTVLKERKQQQQQQLLEQK